MTPSIAAFELVTPDPDRTADFYTNACGCMRRGVALQLGGQVIRLRRAGAAGLPYPSDSTAADIWFQHLAIVTTDIVAAAAMAVAAGATPITAGGPQHLPPRSGGVTAWKFRDPDGHPLELLQFSSGAVPPAWRCGRALHLGIDHSAISVADVDVSIDFYHRQFGFSVAARQVNRGIEQSRLDGLAGARVDVVALRLPGAATPHLELLGYHPPGRPSVCGPDDVAATRIVIETVAATSPGEAHDPDGHRTRWQPA